MPPTPPKPPTTKKKKRLPVARGTREQVPCLACALCCTYIAVGIDRPRNAHAATEILWHLYHQDVSVYCDGEDEWMVQFETRCRHLQPDNRCGIYETRPHICREYSEQTCEVNAEGEGQTFYTPSQFLAYLQQKKKRIYRAIADRYLPGPEHLGEAPRMPRRAPSFEKRFRGLRARGEKP